MVETGGAYNKQMKKKYSIWVTVAVTVIAAIITFQITYIAVDGIYDKKLKNNSVSDIERKLSEIMALYDEMYIGELDESRSLEAVIDAYVASVDKYGAYLTPEEYAERIADNNAEVDGIGVHVIYNAEYSCIEIVNVMPESPAEKAGLLPGDLIVTIEGQPVQELGYYPAIDLVKGERGTNVSLIVRRGEAYAESLEFSVMRDKVTEQTVLHRVTETDAKIGYIRILSFDKGTVGQFTEAVEDLKAKGCEKLVLDVRNNPGGLLNSVTAILDYILPEGPIVRLISKDGTVETIDSDEKCLDMEMIVICNGSTASAGELFTSAIKDYGLAKVIGTVTYGKGTVQQIRPLPDGDALSISYKMYSPPVSDNYEGIGITPDIIVEMEDNVANINIYKLSETEDTQLRRAIEELK